MFSIVSVFLLKELSVYRECLYLLEYRCTLSVHYLEFVVYTYLNLQVIGTFLRVDLSLTFLGLFRKE